MEGQTLGNILCNLLVLPVRYVSVMIQRRLVLCAFETLLQIQTNFNGIFVNLKLITEGQEAINIVCVTKTVKFKRGIKHSKNKLVNYFETRLNLEYTSPALNRHEICLNFRKTSK